MEDLRDDLLLLYDFAQHEDDLLARRTPVQGGLPADQSLHRTVRRSYLPGPEFRFLLEILAVRKEAAAWLLLHLHHTGVPGVSLHPCKFTATGIKGNQQRLLSESDPGPWTTDVWVLPVRSLADHHDPYQRALQHQVRRNCFRSLVCSWRCGQYSRLHHRGAHRRQSLLQMGSSDDRSHYLMLDYGFDSLSFH